MNTIDFYNNKSTQLIERYDNAEMSLLHQLLLKYIPTKAMVLDIGFGSGRDLQFLHDHGYDIWGTDPTKNFVENAKIRFSENRDHFFEEGIPFQKKALEKTVQFDAVISIAVWMHLQHDQYAEAVENIVGVSKPGSVVVISYSEGEREDKDERYFEEVDLENLIELFLAKDFKLIKTIKNEDSLKRNSLSWITVVFKHD
jgi:2-polyprenyl-3-methyl-5-hydroxy-6-metoxy-1,4-benzoquinol methylase